MNNLVFLPGASGNTQFWYPLVAQLPKTYTKQVIAYPSFHGVAAHPDINSFDDLSDYVVEQIQQPSILIAQSMGGIFAIKAALEKTSLIKGLILIATSGGVNLDQFQVQDWREFYQQEYAEYPNWFITTSINYEEFISSIDIKTLLIWGEHDPISPVEVGKYLNHLIEKSNLYIVEGGDHQLAKKCANEVALQINKFLETIQLYVECVPQIHYWIDYLLLNASFKANSRLLAKIKKRSTFCLFFIHIKKSCSTIMST